MKKRSFASDNNAGVHPNILEALQACNAGHVTGYGDDPVTYRTIDKYKQLFGPTCQPYFVYGGTGANVLAVGSMCRPYESLICAETAHINVDECGAPERFSGAKLLDIATKDGKLTPELIKPVLHGFDFEHHSQPKAISITQPTELGTLYTLDEIAALRSLADEYNLYLHMDGARISNAAVAMNLDFKAFTADAGIDILSFGGNKNGLMFGELLIFFNTELAQNFKYVRKQAMQLHSKMRFISAQFEAFLEKDLWHKNASNANTMAQKLAQALEGFKQIKITQKVESNAIFATIPKEVIAPLQLEYFFYVWDENNNEVRWMTSFDTTEEDIDNFIRTLKKYLN